MADTSLKQNCLCTHTFSILWEWFLKLQEYCRPSTGISVIWNMPIYHLQQKQIPRSTSFTATGTTVFLLKYSLTRSTTYLQASYPLLFSPRLHTLLMLFHPAINTRLLNDLDYAQHKTVLLCSFLLLYRH